MLLGDHRNAPGDGKNKLPDGLPVEAPPPPDPLAGLPGLQDALLVMDMAVCQNIYLPKLLQYR
jgi:hypothetical protein